MGVGDALGRVGFTVVGRGGLDLVPSVTGGDGEGGGKEEQIRSKTVC